MAQRLSDSTATGDHRLAMTYKEFLAWADDETRAEWVDVVEVIVADSVTRDNRDKLLEYQKAGVPEYWIVDPRQRWRSVEPYTLTERGIFGPIAPDERGRLHSVVLPGFWLDPDWLWQNPLPRPSNILDLIAPQGSRTESSAPAPKDNGEADGA